MSVNDHEGTEALKALAEEIEAERSSGEHTPFDAQDENDLVDDQDPRENGGESEGGSVPPLAARP